MSKKEEFNFDEVKLEKADKTQSEKKVASKKGKNKLRKFLKFAGGKKK